MNIFDAQWRAAMGERTGLGITIYAVAGSELYDRPEARSTGEQDVPIALCLEDRIAERIVELHNANLKHCTRGYR